MAQTRPESPKIQDQSGQFRCPECGETFQTENELREHSKACPQPVSNR